VFGVFYIRTKKDFMLCPLSNLKLEPIEHRFKSGALGGSAHDSNIHFSSRSEISLTYGHETLSVQGGMCSAWEQFKDLRFHFTSRTIEEDRTCLVFFKCYGSQMMYFE